MDRLLQPATPPLDLRRQDTRRGLCYGRNDGEIGGVKTNPIHLSQAAKLSHQAGPPQKAISRPCITLAKRFSSASLTALTSSNREHRTVFRLQQARCPRSLTTPTTNYPL